MKRPKLKKASKRMSCAKRFKIQKKVREHHRKLRRDAKKSGIGRKIKKDVGVPNSAPFKEQVLREAEQRKQELEELKEKNKLAKQKERAEQKKRKINEGERVEPTPAKKKRLTKTEKIKAQKEKRAAVAKQKSAKKFRCSELNKVIDASDVILEVLDARDPMGCRCPQLEEAVLKHQGQKRLMFVLNKCDLVPKDNLMKWAWYLQTQCPTFVFKSSVLIRDKLVPQKKQRAVSKTVERSAAAASFGCDSLMKTLELLAKSRDSETMLKVGVVGFPNVGKSSVVNSLKGIRACNVGVPRGLTKCMQEVHLSETVKMIDSPAIVAAPSNFSDKLALRGLEEEKEENSLQAVKDVLKQCVQQHIMLYYNVPKYRTSLEFLTFYAKKRGLLQKGALPDTVQAATLFLKDWTGAKLSYYSKVPEREGLPPHLTKALLRQMQKDVDMDRIKIDNKKTIKCVRTPKLSATIVYNSKGLTAGILNVQELPEEDVEDHEEDEEEMFDETDKMEDIKEIETQSQKTGKQKKGINPATFNIDLLATQKTDGDDAYDFSTDFV